MKRVHAKKYLGQHFLKEGSIAEKIALTLPNQKNFSVLEIGPGMGMLTQFILKQEHQLKLVEIDSESVAYLKEHYPALRNHIIEKDILKLDFDELFGNAPFAVIGNFPYNISSQILFKVLNH